MKRFIVLSLMVCISFLSVFSQRSERILEEGWKFARGRYASAEKVNYDYKLWSSVTVPHDYAILGPFDRNNDLQDVMNIQNKEIKKLPLLQLIISSSFYHPSNTLYYTLNCIKKKDIFIYLF